jgi:AbrB family transcriptional regulator (stage V sporulation protein T)
MTYASKLINGGKVVIPAELRRKLGVVPGDTLVFEEDDKGNVLLKTYRQVVKEVQEEMKRMIPPGVSLVEDLFAERRREFEMEQREAREYEERHGRSKP